MTQSTTDRDGFPNVCDQGTGSGTPIAATTPADDPMWLRCGACGKDLPLDKMFDHIHGECPVPWEVLEDADAE